MLEWIKQCAKEFNFNLDHVYYKNLIHKNNSPVFKYGTEEFSIDFVKDAMPLHFITMFIIKTTQSMSVVTLPIHRVGFYMIWRQNKQGYVLNLHQNAILYGYRVQTETESIPFYWKCDDCACYNDFLTTGWCSGKIKGVERKTYES